MFSYGFVPLWFQVVVCFVALIFLILPAALPYVVWKLDGMCFRERHSPYWERVWLFVEQKSNTVLCDLVHRKDKANILKISCFPGWDFFFFIGRWMLCVCVHQVVSWLDNIYFCMWDHQLCEHTSETVPRLRAQAPQELLVWRCTPRLEYSVCDYLVRAWEDECWLKWCAKCRYNRIFQCKFCYCTYGSIVKYFWELSQTPPKRFIVVLCIYMYSRDQCNW